MRTRDAIKQNFALFRLERAELHVGHGLFVQPGGVALRGAESAGKGVEHCIGWRLPFEHASGILDFVFQVKVSSFFFMDRRPMAEGGVGCVPKHVSKQTADTRCFLADFYPTPVGPFPLIIEAPASAAERAAA